MSGYVHCVCRDCFQIAIAAMDETEAFCSDCEEAGCERDKECQAPHAYCQGEETDDGYCADCGEEF